MKPLNGISLFMVALTLVACSDEPKKYDYENGIMGENVVGKTPQESVEVLRGDYNPTDSSKDAWDSTGAKPTRTPLDGLSTKEQEVVTKVDYFYQHLMNAEFDQIDALISPKKRITDSFGDYYRDKMEGNGIILLDFKVDRISDRGEEVIVEVDVEQIVIKEVITYRDSVTLLQVDGKWFIDAIETEVK